MRAMMRGLRRTFCPGSMVMALLFAFPVRAATPFVNETVDAVSFELQGAAKITLEAYNVAGQRVAKRAPQVFAAAGEYNIQWHVGILSPGVYFMRLATAGGATGQAKFTIVR